MKQSNLKVVVTGLTISVCLLAGSAIATVKAGKGHEHSLQNQQAEIQVADTQLRVNLAPENQSETPESNLLLGIISPKMTLMSAQISSPQGLPNNTFQAEAQSAAIQAKVVTVTQVKSEPIVEVKVKTDPIKSKAIVAIKPKAFVQVKSQTQAKKTTATVTSKKVIATQLATTAKKEASASKVSGTSETHTLEISAGKTIEYSRLIPVKATAYTAAAEENGIWGAFDYFGNPLKLGTIAVDPDVIPMGSTVYITGYSFDGLPAKGMIAKATDQGSSVQGKRVDIFVPTSQADATKFGMQDVKIYIVK